MVWVILLVSGVLGLPDDALVEEPPAISGPGLSPVGVLVLARSVVPPGCRRRHRRDTCLAVTLTATVFTWREHVGSNAPAANELDTDRRWVSRRAGPDQQR